MIFTRPAFFLPSTVEDRIIINRKPYCQETLCRKNKTNRKCLSRKRPITPIAFPIVNAAKTVPIPRPLICPKNIPVIPTVTARQIVSKRILTIEYPAPVICVSSLGKRSVGTIGRPQRFERAMLPKTHRVHWK